MYWQRQTAKTFCTVMSMLSPSFKFNTQKKIISDDSAMEVSEAFVTAAGANAVACNDGN
jgi:hypothetical protein